MMKRIDREQLIKLMIRHEGLELKAYRCKSGKVTIGVGRNLDDNGISEEEALFLLGNDLRAVNRSLSYAYPWYDMLIPERRMALISMCFNLGFADFQAFKKMIAAIEAQDFELAADEMMNSKWFSQVPNRVRALANIMRSGRIEHE